MKTTLPFSTISYNTTPYLELKLNELLKSHVISFWAYVKHLPEEDERKEHHHVWVIPSRGCFTDTFLDEFIEPVPDNPKPLRCLPCQSSKNFADWCLYALHDEKYLMTKGQSRKYHYRYEHIVSSDEDFLLELYKRIDVTKLTPYEAIMQAVGNGLNFDEFVAQGQVPIPQFWSWKQAFDSVTKAMFSTHETERNDKSNHEPEKDE